MSDETYYEVCVSGPVSAQVLNQIPDVEVNPTETRTILVGHFVDQAALYGLLNRVRGLGLEVVEVRRRSDPPEADEPAGGEPR